MLSDLTSVRLREARRPGDRVRTAPARTDRHAAFRRADRPRRGRGEPMHVFETPGSVSLQIKLPSGRVVVTTADEPRTTVEVVASRSSRPGRGRRDRGDDGRAPWVVTSSGSSRRTGSAGGRSRSPGAATSSAGSPVPPGTDLELAGGRPTFARGRARRGLRSDGVRRHQARNRSPRAPGQDGERRHRRHRPWRRTPRS